MPQPVIFVKGRAPQINYSGAESYVRAIGRAALRAGYEPHIFCVGPAARVETTPFGIVHCAKTPFRPIRALMAFAHGRYIVDAIERFAAERGGPFLIQSFGAWSGVAAEAARHLARRGAACRLIATAWTTYAHQARGKVRGASDAHGTWNRLVLRWELGWTLLAVAPSAARGLREADLVHVNYDSVRAIVAAEVGHGLRFRKTTYASESAFLGGEGARAAAPEPITRLEPREAPLIVAVSRHDARKGLDVLLRALALLRVGGVRFRACLVGAGALLPDHRALAAKLDLLACTSLPGRVPDAFAYHQHADVFALPSLEEGSGSVSLLEAMQAGAAPVVSRVDGLPEDISDGESGLLVMPGSVDELACALRRLIEDAALRAKLAAGAHAVYRARFTADAFAADLGKAYASLGFPAAAPADCAQAAFARTSAAQ